MARVGIRQFLRDQGYRDEDIGFDYGADNSGTGRVTLLGRTFTYATPEADSKTYGDTEELTRALRQFRQNQLAEQARGTLGQIQQAANAPIQQFTAPQPFTYNPESDPAYQAALRTARQNIALEQANTNARLRATGQGKSSYSEAVANQIATQGMGRITNEVLPQLINQAYQRYVDQANRDLQLQQLNYGLTQDRLRNLATVYGLQNELVQQGDRLTQQDFENALRQQAFREQQRQANIENAMRLGQQFGTYVYPTESGQALFEQVQGLTPLNMRQFEADQAARQFAQDMQQRQFALQERQTEAQLANMAADNARAAAQLAMQQEEFRNNQQARNFIGQLMDDLGQLDNEQDIRDFLNLNAGEIASVLGIQTYNQILKSALAPFEQQRAAQNQQSQAQQEVYAQALRLAQSDPSWIGLDSAGRQQLISEYVRMLQSR